MITIFFLFIAACSIGFFVVQSQIMSLKIKIGQIEDKSNAHERELFNLKYKKPH